MSWQLCFVKQWLILSKMSEAMLTPSPLAFSFSFLQPLVSTASEHIEETIHAGMKVIVISSRAEYISFINTSGLNSVIEASESSRLFAFYLPSVILDSPLASRER
jgi:hypothetical protein